jgi:hypothetical protein
MDKLAQNVGIERDLKMKRSKQLPFVSICLELNSEGKQATDRLDFRTGRSQISSLQISHRPDHEVQFTLYVRGLRPADILGEDDSLLSEAFNRLTVTSTDPAKSLQILTRNHDHVRRVFRTQPYSKNDDLA